VTADMEQACSWEPTTHTNVLAGAPFFTLMHTDANTRTCNVRSGLFLAYCNNSTKFHMRGMELIAHSYLPHTETQQHI